MAITLSLDEDYLIWDNVETVHFDSVNRITGTQRTDVLALRRALTTRELTAANGAYTGQDVAWLIPKKPISDTAFAPKPGDKVVDAVSSWTALEVKFINVRQVWRLVCRNLALAYGLRDKITIEQATRSTDSVGAIARPAWTAIYTDIGARVQPMNAEVKFERGVDGQEQAYTIIVDRELSLIDVRNCRVPWLGKYLDLRSYRMAELITELPRLEAVLKA